MTYCIFQHLHCDLLSAQAWGQADGGVENLSVLPFSQFVAPLAIGKGTKSVGSLQQSLVGHTERGLRSGRRLQTPPCLSHIWEYIHTTYVYIQVQSHTHTCTVTKEVPMYYLIESAVCCTSLLPLEHPRAIDTSTVHVLVADFFTLKKHRWPLATSQLLAFYFMHILLLAVLSKNKACITKKY